MKKIRGIFCVVASAFLAAYGASAAAQAVEEVEENFPMTSAQPLEFDSSGTATVNAFMRSGDADVFSFRAYKGNKITLDIDRGVKDVAGSIDTIVSFHHPAAPTLEDASPYQVIDWNDDSAAPDEGSLGAGDSYLPVPEIPADGVYYVAVTGYDNRVFDGGVFSGGVNLAGSYTLIVSGVVAPDPDPKPEVQKISIDIKPGIKVIERTDPKSRREVPVALLSSGTFDARTVNVSSLTFGRTGEEKSLKGCNKGVSDVNGDGLPDLVCHFENQRAGFEPSDERAIVKGMSSDGTAFEGEGNLKVVPHKRQGHRWDGDHRRGRDHDRGGRRDR